MLFAIFIIEQSEEQRIGFKISKTMKFLNMIHWKYYKCYNVECLSKSKDFKWYKLIAWGAQAAVEDEHRSGCRKYWWKNEINQAACIF